MKVLLVKMSSLGDVIHALPAVADLMKSVSNVQLTWVVEEAYVELPALNQDIDSTIAIAIRRWRRAWFKHLGEISLFRSKLRDDNYDVVIDAQGLLKSALVASMAKGPVHGLNRQSAKEPLASFFYDKCYKVDKSLHAVERVRQLFAQIFGYDTAPLPLDYGVLLRRENSIGKKHKPRLFFLHGTTWDSKHWPEERWLALAQRAVNEGFEVNLTYGNQQERQRAERIAKNLAAVTVLPPKSLTELIDVMATCMGVVSVDTGLGHLACALGIPLVSIYGPTDPELTGTHGLLAATVQANNLACIPCLNRECQYKVGDMGLRVHPPCFDTSTSAIVFDRLANLMEKEKLV